MRIEISAGGVGSVSQFQKGLSTLRSSIASTIEDLRTVNRKMNNLSGGLGNLTDAYKSVQTRINEEQNRLDSVDRVSKATEDFLNHTVYTDTRVARLVSQNKERFFNNHPWLRPSVTEEKSRWQQWVEDWSAFWSSPDEFFKKAIDGIVGWVKEHAVEIIIGAVAIVVGAAIVALTGGAAAAFIPALLAGLKAATISAVISGAISAALAALTGNDVLNAFGDGLASGFMWGGIFYAIGSLFTAIKNVATNIHANSTKTYPRDVLDTLSSPNATDNAVEHIFEGQINPRGKPVGYHYNMIDGTPGKIVDGSKEFLGKGIYNARVEINGKSKFSTFFPDNMSPIEVWSSINEAFQNASRLPGSNMWEGISNSGMHIRFYLDSGKFATAFPAPPKIPKIIQAFSQVHLFGKR